MNVYDATTDWMDWEKLGDFAWLGQRKSREEIYFWVPFQFSVIYSNLDDLGESDPFEIILHAEGEEKEEDLFYFPSDLLR